MRVPFRPSFRGMVPIIKFGVVLMHNRTDVAAREGGPGTITATSSITKAPGHVLCRRNQKTRTTTQRNHDICHTQMPLCPQSLTWCTRRFSPKWIITDTPEPVACSDAIRPRSREYHELLGFGGGTRLPGRSQLHRGILFFGTKPGGWSTRG